MDDKKFRTNSVIAILNTTKISSTDNQYLFHIEEREIENEFNIVVVFRDAEILKMSTNYSRINSRNLEEIERDKGLKIGILRGKILKKIIVHFCGK